MCRVHAAQAELTLKFAEEFVRKLLDISKSFPFTFTGSILKFNSYILKFVLLCSSDMFKVCITVIPAY